MGRPLHAVAVIVLATVGILSPATVPSTAVAGRLERQFVDDAPSAIPAGLMLQCVNTGLGREGAQPGSPAQQREQAQTPPGSRDNCSPIDLVEAPSIAPLAASGSVVAGSLPPHTSVWLRFGYRGSGRAIALTLQLPNPPMLDARGARLDPIDVMVNTRTQPDQTMGEPNADWPGMTRLGSLTQTQNSGLDRRFWLSSSGPSETYYLRIFNHSALTVPFALGFDDRDPGNPLAITPASIAAYIAIARDWDEAPTGAE